jgi:hypothetical protein
MMLDIDWHDAFVPTVHLGELFLRGSIVYLFLCFAFRSLRRQAGAIGVSDLVAVVLIADAAQNAMAAEYRSVPKACCSALPFCSGTGRTITSATGSPGGGSSLSIHSGRATR